MISAIVPVYNVEKYLKRCISSILAQSYEDWEMILVDDGSSDRSGEICEYYASADNRIKVFHKENGGVSSARNMGLEQISGEYIFFPDADDWLEKETFSRLLDAIEKTDADIAACDVFNVRELPDNKIVRTRGLKWGNLEEEITLSGKEAFYRVMKKSATLWNKLFRAEYVKGIRFNTAMTFGEDSEFLFRSMRGHDRITLIPYAGYNYVYTRQGNVVSEGITPRVFEFLKNTEILYDMMRDSGLGALGVYRLYVVLNRNVCKIPVKEIGKAEYKQYYKAFRESAVHPHMKDKLSFYMDSGFLMKIKLQYALICVSPYLRALYRKLQGKNENELI